MFLKKARDPMFWQGVREKEAFCLMREALLRQWEETSKKPVEALKFSNFCLFFTTGDRSAYESAYFSRRYLMNCSAMLALIYPQQEAYLHCLEDVLFAICDEYTWCLPAHQPNCTEDIPDFIDLFASETGFALTEIDTLLGDRLAPLVRERIRHEAKRRVIDSFIDRHYWWETFDNNWSAVCTCGVAATVMYLKPELFETLRPRFEESMRHFLSAFGDDGFCLEGIDYWHYGFGFFMVYADLVRDFTNGEYDCFRDKKVRSIATFAQKVFLSGDVTVSFADGSRKGHMNVGMLHYLRREYGDIIALVEPSANTSCAWRERWCIGIRGFVWLNEENHVTKERPSDFLCYAKNAQWYLKKNNRFGFAAKGGHNEEPHNHNDIGSFIIASGGEQIFCDYGAALYTRQYFRLETRYDTIQCSSLGHSVPFFGQHIQKVGEAFRARNARQTKDGFTADIAPAYGYENLHQLCRTFVVTEDSVTLTDAFSYDGIDPITERFVLLFEPKLTENGFTVSSLSAKYGKEVLCAKVTPCTIQEHTPGKTTLSYLLDLTLAPDTKQFSLTVDIK